MTDISFYKLCIWRQLCKRDFEESEARKALERSPAPAPHHEQRLADLYAGMEETSEAAGRVAALFKEKL